MLKTWIVQYTLMVNAHYVVHSNKSSKLSKDNKLTMKEETTSTSMKLYYLRFLSNEQARCLCASYSDAEWIRTELGAIRGLLGWRHAQFYLILRRRPGVLFCRAVCLGFYSPLI